VVTAVATLIDYLYVSVTNSTAFSSTDTMSLFRGQRFSCRSWGSRRCWPRHDAPRSASSRGHAGDVDAEPRAGGAPGHDEITVCTIGNPRRAAVR